ncbi:hypothetical protein DFH08DRAFT_837337 [Mycena albidolilacea]|uniref:Uncharacterized protein n=1 Tax=Mycena albidolilacea TaxID=1033008 RepID=A0AAD7ASX9_9AGAR|nr:hypothetical protein DFH08DRAFT_837337 [Mycena albidolilacea]
MLLAIHQTSITSEQLGDDDRVNGCKLLLNLRSTFQLDKAETAALRLANLEVLISVKLLIVALCALLELAPGAVPESLNYGWPGIAGGVLKIFIDLPEAIAARKALEELESGDDDGKILNMNEDDEDVWDEDSAYLEMLANEVQKSEKNEEDGEDSDDDDEISEELLYILQCPGHPFQMQNAPVSQAATTSLTLE